MHLPAVCIVFIVIFMSNLLGVINEVIILVLYACKTHQTMAVGISIYIAYIFRARMVDIDSLEFRRAGGQVSDVVICHFMLKISFQFCNKKVVIILYANYLDY